MEWLQWIFNPPVTVSLKETAKIMLPVTGMLLGLVYVTLIYWLQGGLSRLEHTKTILEDLLTANGKVIVDLLFGASLMSLFAILGIHLLITLSFWFFGIIFLFDLLKETTVIGYVTTLFSSKFIPSHYGKNREFLRKILNAGLAGWIKPIFLYGICVVYPVIVSQNMTDLPSLSEKSIVLFIVISTTIALFQVKYLLFAAFDTRKTLEREMATENEQKAMSLDEKPVIWSKQKRKLETMVIEERLRSIGVIQWVENNALVQKESWNSRDLQDTPMLEYKPGVEEHGSCHLNIIIPYLRDDQHTREFIFYWSKRILEVIAKSKTEICQYSLSFFRKEGGTKDTHFAMIRAGREEVLKGLSQYSTDEDFVRSLPGKYLSSAVAEF
jgi:hypothetical protein